MVMKSRKDVRHDDSGSFDTAGGSQLSEGAQGNGEGIETSHGASSPASLDSDISTERSISAQAEIIPGELEELIGISNHFSSGPIPDGVSLAEYSPDVQERILDWQDRQVRAMFDDESKRQDRLVDAAIKHSGRDQILSFSLNICIAVGAILAFILTQNPHSFWAFAIPGVSAIGNVIIDLSGHGKDRMKQEAKDKEQ